MDLESRFIECCIACNSTSQQCQSNDSPIHGQGDCKCNTEYRDNQNYWMALEKEKKFRTKFAREKNDFELRQETQKKFLLDAHCDCLGKEDFSDRLKHDGSQDDKFESCGYCWDSPYSSWKAKSDGYIAHGQTKSAVYSYDDLLVTENHLGFKEKVDFLFRIFKDYGQDLSVEGFVGHKKDTAGKGGDFADLNRRLCAAEEGIEKLAFIVGDLVKDLKKRRATEGLESSESLDFDDMSVVQRINYLKSKNDLLLSFMKAFFKAGSSEETDVKVESSPENHCKKSPVSPKHPEKNYSKEPNREEVVEMLKKLRVEMTELRQKKTKNSTEQRVPKKEKPGEAALKFTGNKLEVISEQAELVLSDDSRKEDFRKRRGDQNFKGFTPVAEESDENEFSVQEFPSKILAQEAELLSPFGKVNFIKSQLESGTVHSKLDSNEKKITLEKTTSDKNKGEGDKNFNALSFYDSDDADKPSERKRAHPGGKPSQKEGEKSGSKDQTKPMNGGATARKTEETTKNSSARKVFQKNSYTVLLPSKSNQKGCSVLEVNIKREGRKKEKELRQRPVTDPSSQRKTLSPSDLKPLVLETCPKKNSGINNVKNKNKILLSKKTCVQTP